MANSLTITKKTCSICNREYTPSRVTSIACSKKCSDKLKYELAKESYKCDCCGEIYHANKYNNNRNDVNICSESCRSKLYWDKNKNKHQIIDGQSYKLCSSCNKLVLIDEFKKDKSKWDSLSNVCFDCYRTYVREIWSKTIKGVLSRKTGKANRRLLESQNGKISSDLIKNIYNENINKYGTLTCIYCLKECNDKWHLEHKNPLCKGGNNSKENLEISCPACNLKKAKKTYEEFIIQIKV